MDIRPVDLPRLRDQTLRGVAEQIKAHWAEDQPAAEEARRLTRADLFHVSESMTQLARAAATSLPDFTLAPEDLPSPCGFVYFAAPINVYKSDEGFSIAITAASWGAPSWIPERATWPDGAVLVTWYIDVHYVMREGVRDGSCTADEAAEARATLPRLTMEYQSMFPFGVPIDRDSGSDHGYDYVKEFILKSVWLLMSQPLASNEPARYDRAARRRFQRDGVEPPEVRVITLRRPQGGTGESSDSGREYHHQWIVRGHWRQQWYPTREVHRPVWIAPHIKGPEGAPVLGGEKVHALKH